MHASPLFTRAFALAAAATLMLSLSGFLFVHLPGYLHQLGAAEAEIGRIMAMEAVGAILAWPFVGRVMDARGRRVVIVCGCALYVAVVALYQYVGSLGPFVYVVRLLHGVAHTMWYTALFTHAADIVPVRRRTQGLAIFGTSGLVTIGLGAQFGDWILAYADYRALFLGALGFATLGLLLALGLRDVRLVHDDVAHPARGIGAAATQTDLLPVWLAAATFFVSLGALFTFMKTFVAAREIGTVGGFFTAYASVAVLLRLFLGWLPDRIGPRRMLGIAMLCQALGFAVLAAAQAPAFVLAAGLLCGAGHGYTYPVLFSLVVERARSRQRGTAMAFYITLDWLGLLLAGPIVGGLIERTSYATSFAAVALLLLTGIGLFYLVDRSGRSVRAT